MWLCRGIIYYACADQRWRRRGLGCARAWRVDRRSTYVTWWILVSFPDPTLCAAREKGLVTLGRSLGLAGLLWAMGRARAPTQLPLNKAQIWLVSSATWAIQIGSGWLGTRYGPNAAKVTGQQDGTAWRLVTSYRYIGRGAGGLEHMAQRQLHVHWATCGRPKVLDEG